MGNIASQVTMSTTGTVYDFNATKLIDGILGNNVYVRFAADSNLILNIPGNKKITEIKLYGTTGYVGLGWIVYDGVFYGGASSHAGPSNPIIIPINATIPTITINFNWPVSGNTYQFLSEVEIYADDTPAAIIPQNQAMSGGT